MPIEILMPRLSDSMEEGTILRWLKALGDEVSRGEALVEIETDKANMVFEADAAGTLIEIVASEGSTLPIGEVIARVGEASEAPSAEGAGTEEAPAKEAPLERAVAGDEPSPPPSDAAVPSATRADPVDERPAASTVERSSDGSVKASPIARRLARDSGLDIAAIQGSGPGGRITKTDVEIAASGSATLAHPIPPLSSDGASSGAGKSRAIAQAQPPAPAGAPSAPPFLAAPAGPTLGTPEKAATAKGEVEVAELTRLQQTVSRRMAESKATAPHFYLSAEIDMSRAVTARAHLKAQASGGELVPSLNDMVVKACANALRELPRANGAYRDGRLELYSRINVGIAVAAQDALVVPTIFDADQKGLNQIASESRALAQRVREGTVAPPELSGGTFTVSNLGMYGMSSIGPVINPPQAAILGVGEINARPVARNGAVKVGHVMGVTLACDHRVLYGADAAEFLGRIRTLLEGPLGLAS